MGQLTGAVIIEKRVETCSIDEDRLGAHNAKTPGVRAVTDLALARGHEVGVVELLHR